MCDTYSGTKITYTPQNEQISTAKESVTKAEIIATLQFAAQNVPSSFCENLAACYQKKFPDAAISSHT